jgi:Fe-S cluster biogenesis protein NfuA|tara:strand:+ start:227 stop:565 length:339 start_codon:yes stop_codon:yes gene_type:complete
MGFVWGNGLKALRLLRLVMTEVDRQLILENVGPVQAVLDAHDGVVNVIDTTDGIIMIGLEGGCTGCSSTPMTAMQIYYALMKLNEVNDVVFVNGELPEYMRTFIDDKLKSEE